LTSNSTNNLYGVWGSSSSDIFAVGVSGTTLHYDGSAWSTQTSGTTTKSPAWCLGSSSPMSSLSGTAAPSSTARRPPLRAGDSLHQPQQSVQGQQKLSVTVTGTYFLGATTVSFGSQVTVDNLTVSSSKITADISIDSSAVLGARDISVTTPAGTAL